MRRLTCLVSLFAILFAVSNTSAQQTNASTIPNLINYSGTLLQPMSVGVPSMIVGVTFAIYKQQEGGAPVWLETQNVTPDASGHYSVLLGSTRAEGLPADLFSTQEGRWLGVQVQGQAEQPRVMLVSVPYAMKAAEADKLSGHSASEFVTTDSLLSAVKEQLQQQTTLPSQAHATTLGVVTNATSDPYIDNGTALQTSANFNIDGNGSAATLNAASVYKLGGVAMLGTTGSQGLFLGAGAGQNNTGNYNLFLGASAGQSNTTANYNTFIGYAAGKSNTTGTPLTFIGVNAGYNNTTGIQNFFLGVNAGYGNTTGSNNIFIGNSTGYKNTSGGQNTFVGIGSGYANTTGSNNSFVGTNAGLNSTASSNTFLGAWSGSADTTGGSNTFVGMNAGKPVTTGSSNTFLGVNAGLSAGTAASNDVFIANQGAAADTGIIRIGDPANQTAAYMAGINGATTSSGVPVFIDSTGKLGTAGGSLGGVTSFNGRTGAVVPAANDYSFSLLSGTLQDSQLSGTYTNALTLNNAANSFAGSFTGNGLGLTGVLPAGGSPNYIQNGTAQQTGASFNIDGNGTTGGTLSAKNYNIGASSVLSIGNSADGTLFVGGGAGSSNVSGQGLNNVFVGSDAGQGNTIGLQNTFVGSKAGQLNTSGGSNVFIGISAGQNNLTASNNVFVGAGAGQQNTSGGANTLVGEQAGELTTTGGNNTYYGYYAGVSATTANYNSLLGSGAGSSTTTGSNNNFFGSNAGLNNTTGNNNIYFGPLLSG